MNLSRNITMRCSVCGNDMFSTVDTSIGGIQDAPRSAQVRCCDCGYICTKEELISDNQENINANIEDVKKEAIYKFKKELEKSLKSKR